MEICSSADTVFAFITERVQTIFPLLDQQVTILAYLTIQPGVYSVFITDLRPELSGIDVSTSLLYKTGHLTPCLSSQT